MKAAYESALKLLTVRERGRRELARSLEERGFTAAAAGDAIEVLEREGWLNDLAAARAAVRARAGRYGKARLERELAARGFPAETIGTALAELDPEAEEKALSRLFARLWRASAGSPADKRRRRVWSALSRRGFSAAAISAKMNVLRKDDES